MMTGLLAFAALLVLNPVAVSGGSVQAGYYAVRYPGENGPFASKRAAVADGLTVLRARADAEDWGCEWLILISRDRYGRWWHTSPKTGREVAPNMCEVAYSSAEIRRPGSTLVATAHTHPRGDLFPDPRPDPPDNRNGHEMFLLRSDGQVWRFGPHSRAARPYSAARTCSTGAAGRARAGRPGRGAATGGCRTPSRCWRARFPTRCGSSCRCSR